MVKVKKWLKKKLQINFLFGVMNIIEENELIKKIFII